MSGAHTSHEVCADRSVLFRGDVHGSQLEHAVGEKVLGNANVVLEADEEFVFPFVDLGKRKWKNVRKVGVHCFIVVYVDRLSHKSRQKPREP